MPVTLEAEGAIAIWEGAVVESVRAAGPDLSQRQLAIVLTVYSGEAPPTVRGLAARLNIAKPAVTRALDRLEELGFVRRLPDQRDKRSITVGRTVKGAIYLREMADRLVAAAKNA